MRILTPLRYCESRGMSAYENEGDCTQFASSVIHGMPFCEHHGDFVKRAIDDEGVELVKDSDKKLREVG